jgi:hypothetical protein
MLVSLYNFLCLVCTEYQIIRTRIIKRETGKEGEEERRRGGEEERRRKNRRENE